MISKSTKVIDSNNLLCKASNKKQRYIVIGLNRSGTTLVHLCLKGHPATRLFWASQPLQGWACPDWLVFGANF